MNLRMRGLGYYPRRERDREREKGPTAQLARFSHFTLWKAEQKTFYSRCAKQTGSLYAANY